MHDANLIKALPRPPKRRFFDTYEGLLPESEEWLSTHFKVISLGGIDPVINWIFGRGAYLESKDDSRIHINNNILSKLDIENGRLEWSQRLEPLTNLVLSSDKYAVLERDGKFYFYDSANGNYLSEMGGEYFKSVFYPSYDKRWLERTFKESNALMKSVDTYRKLGEDWLKKGNVLSASERLNYSIPIPYLRSPAEYSTRFEDTASVRSALSLNNVKITTVNTFTFTSTAYHERLTLHQRSDYLKSRASLTAGSGL